MLMNKKSEKVYESITNLAQISYDPYVQLFENWPVRSG